MGRVHDEDIEELKSTRLGGESLDVIGLGLEIFKKSEGRGEAVSKLDSFVGEDGSSLLSKTVVLETLNETEKVGGASSGVDGEAGHEGNRDAGADRGTISSLVDPSETVGIDLTMFIMEANKTLAEVSFESVFSSSDSLLGPSGVESSFSAL